MAAPSELAAVVLDVPGGDLGRAVSSLRDLGADVVAVRQGGPASGADLEVFPLGTCYARNRGAAATEARALTFLDSDAVVEPSFVSSMLSALERAPAAVTAPALAFRRLEFEAAGGFDNALGLGTTRRGVHDAELALRLGSQAGRQRFGGAEAVAAGRVARRRRDPVLAGRAALRGGLAGVLGRHEWAPLDPPPARPDELAELGPLTPLAASNPAKTHFLYSAGSDLVVHLHVNPSERLERSLAEREAIRERAGNGVPALRRVVTGRDCLWAVEDRAAGETPPPERVHEWFPLAADWLQRMADPARTPLDQSAAWARHAEDLRATYPGLDRALALVGGLPAVAMHGDLQRRNLLLDGDTVSAVDWEGAWLEGIPGLDLVFLALFATGEEPDLGLIARLAGGADAPWGLRAPLARLGIFDDVLPAALAVMLATWALAEDRRRARLGSAPPRAVFRPLLDELGPELMRRVG